MTTERDHDVGAFPAPVYVKVAGRWLRGFAHGTRIVRRGHQILVSHGGRYVWIRAARVRRRTDAVPPVDVRHVAE